MDIYNSQLRYGFRYLVYLVSPLLLERLTSISILLYQFEGQAYDIIHRGQPRNPVDVPVGGNTTRI